jgi:hypothetical protein
MLIRIELIETAPAEAGADMSRFPTAEHPA